MCSTAKGGSSASRAERNSSSSAMRPTKRPRRAAASRSAIRGVCSEEVFFADIVLRPWVTALQQVFYYAMLSPDWRSIRHIILWLIVREPPVFALLGEIPMDVLGL